MKSPSLTQIVSLLLLGLSFPLAFAQKYTVTDLGSVVGPEGFAVARGINASGQVTGQSGPASGAFGNVFVYSDGAMDNLGALPGGANAFGISINTSGQVAGGGTNAKGTYRAFISEDNKLVDIGDLGGGTAYGEAINDSGQVAGESASPTVNSEPFLYTNGTMIGLGNLGSNTGWATARGINNSGVVVGSSWTAQFVLHGFAWNGTMNDLGTLGGPYSQAWAINNSGQITGLAYLANSGQHAFITTIGGTMQDLGVIAELHGNPAYAWSWGFAINDSGEVVGQASAKGTGDMHAFVYQAGKMKDLNTLVPKSAWVLFEARGVNNAGEIICTGLNAAGNQHAFLLTPSN